MITCIVSFICNKSYNEVPHVVTNSNYTTNLTYDPHPLYMLPYSQMYFRINTSNKNIDFQRQFFYIAHGKNSVAMYLYTPPTANENAPVVIILPGLNSKTKSRFNMSMCEQAKVHGFRVAVFVRVGHDVLKVGSSADLPYVDEHIKVIALCKYLKKALQPCKMYGIGLCFGASCLAKVVCSDENPFDQGMAMSMNLRLYDSLTTTSVLQHFLTNNTKEYFQSHKCWDIPKLEHVRSLVELVNVVYPKFSHVQSSKHFGEINDSDLESLKVPCIFLQSKDDPLIRRKDVPCVKNPNAIFVTTKHGSHCMWLQREKSYSWAIDLFIESCNLA